jgi:hypothetical protein
MLALAVIVLVYLALVIFQVRNHHRVTIDEHIFLDVGSHIDQTGLPYRTYGIHRTALFFDHTPLYVYWVAAVTLLGGPTTELVRSTTLVFGLLSLLGVHWIGRTVRGPVAGLVGAAVLATNPFYATWSWFVHMEVPLSCALVFALLAIVHGRWLFAGLLIAVAVLLKEIALGFMAVAFFYAVMVSGWRAGLAVAMPSVVALGAWFAYAASIGQTQLMVVLHRWYASAAGGDIADKRMNIRLSVWAQTIVQEIFSLTGILATGAAAALALLDRRAIPRIVIVPVAYLALAVASSFVIMLKEPRYLIAVVPMLAVSVALVADWDAFVRAVRRPPERSAA